MDSRPSSPATKSLGYDHDNNIDKPVYQSPHVHAQAKSSPEDSSPGPPVRPIPIIMLTTTEGQTSVIFLPQFSQFDSSKLSSSIDSDNPTKNRSLVIVTEKECEEEMCKELPPKDTKSSITACRRPRFPSPPRSNRTPVSWIPYMEAPVRPVSRPCPRSNSWIPSRVSRLLGGRKDRENEKEKERKKEKEQEKERENEKEKEREKERDKEREKERERERENEREKEREKEKKGRKVEKDVAKNKKEMVVRRSRKEKWERGTSTGMD